MIISNILGDISFSTLGSSNEKAPWPGGQGAKHSNVKRPNKSLSSQNKQLLNHFFSIIM